MQKINDATAHMVDNQDNNLWALTGYAMKSIDKQEHNCNIHYSFLWNWRKTPNKVWKICYTVKKNKKMGKQLKDR